MASNYFPVSLLEQPWDDGEVGTLSSLERRQRKAAEKQDVNAFYKFLGVVFVSFSLVLLGSELYTFATEPSRGLTGAFLMEIGRMSGVAYGQMQNLYKAVGDVAWTGLAVVHGHDFAQRGVSITDGAAQLLASGLYYLALALSVLIMYYAYPGVSRAPLRTAALSTIAAGALFGAPPLYAWLVSRLCQTRNPEPVVLWALLFAAIMCWASFCAARAISDIPGEGPHAQPSPARHRNFTAPRRQAAAGAAAGVGGASGGGGAAAASLGASGAGGGGSATATGGQKRSSYSRASSLSGRSGGTGVMAPGDATQPSVARSGSTASLTGHGLLAGLNCLSGAAGTAAADPVGIHTSARGLQGGGSCGSSSIDLVSSAAPSCFNAKQGSAMGAAANGRCGPTGQSSTSSTFDPVGVSGKFCGHSASRGTGAAVGNSNSSCSGSTASAAKASTHNSGKQRQQPGGADGGKAKQAAGAGFTSLSNQARCSGPDPVSTCGAGGGSKASAGSQPSDAKQQLQQHSDPVAASTAPATVSSSAAATAATKKKSLSNTIGSSSSVNGTSTAFTGATAVTNATAAGSNAAGKLSRTEAVAPKFSSGGATTASAQGTASQGKGAQGSGGSVAGSATAGAAAAAATASGAAGLLSRLASSVASAATTAAPTLSNRAAKKAAAAAAATRKPQVQHPPMQAHPPQPQYVFVPPPPPPPRKTQPAAGNAAVSGSAAAGAAGAAASSGSGTGNPVRNAWLNPNPVIKIAAGVAKGPMGAAAAARTPAPTPTATAPVATTAAAMATAPVSRSSGGAPAHFCNTSPPTPSSARSASYGGAALGFGSVGSTGVTPDDPPVLDGYVSTGSPHGFPRPSFFAADIATVAGGPLLGSAVGGPAATAAPTDPASAFLPPVSQEHLRSHFQESAGPGGESYITTTIVSADATMGPLVAHKHASGDLDIANVAANYRPYPSSVPYDSIIPPASAVPPIDAESTDSFSLFSTPPPLITADAVVDPGIAVATACLAGPDADAAEPRAAHMLYGMYGGYGHYAALPSLTGDPVWSHNVPSVFGPQAGPGGARAPRVPPPGFPSHAYGGAFAAGPISGGGGWEQPALAAAAAAAVAAPNGRSDPVPPLPPAGENGVLASLGFVEDGGADSGSTSASANGGGCEDAGASCAICWSAPRQVGFLHGKTSHLCVCRRCAAKLREGVHRCPMCRQLIERIIDIY